jgi:squalene cyclase
MKQAAAKICHWMCEQQRPDGSWTDKWHASPYYATMCGALALHRFGGYRGVPAVRQAVRWVLETQRDDGSWGRWQSTAEETAYSMRILMQAGGASPEEERAVAGGYHYLLDAHQDDPPLWHDKELYLPKAVVRAAVVSAVHLAHQRSRLPGSLLSQYGR